MIVDVTGTPHYGGPYRKKHEVCPGKAKQRTSPMKHVHCLFLESLEHRGRRPQDFAKAAYVWRRYKGVRKCLVSTRRVDVWKAPRPFCQRRRYGRVRGRTSCS